MATTDPIFTPAPFVRTPGAVYSIEYRGERLEVTPFVTALDMTHVAYLEGTTIETMWVETDALVEEVR